MTSESGRLLGKVAIITGATSGIGRSAAELFLAEGARVVASSNDREAGDELLHATASELRPNLRFVEADVSDPDAMERLIQDSLDAFGRLDIVYGNAGISYSGDVTETSPDDWRRVIEINLSGQFYLTKYSIPILERFGGGVVVLTASELALVGSRRLVAYSAAKAGVVALTRALAVDSAPKNIRVNCLAPGPIETPMIERWFNSVSDPAEFRRAAIRPVLLERLGKPEEVAQAALFLASDASSFMTGAVLVVDGGVTSWAGL
jgi:meso-butanediol dehydrogenase/(S,S)-butanediol dehydrogenase/diacetyl reductase